MQKKGRWNGLTPLPLPTLLVRPIHLLLLSLKSSLWYLRKESDLKGRMLHEGFFFWLLGVVARDGSLVIGQLYVCLSSS